MYYASRELKNFIRKFRVLFYFESFDLIITSKSFKDNARGMSALFTDIDGTVWPDLGYGTILKNSRMDPKTLSVLEEYRIRNYLRIGFSNQTLFGYGDKSTNAQFFRYFMKLVDLVKSNNFDAISICHHHPKSKLKFLRRDCPRRKPMPGLITPFGISWGVNLSGSIGVGDRITDVMSACEAGISKTFLIMKEYSFEFNESPRTLDNYTSYEFDLIDELSDLL